MGKDYTSRYQEIIDAYRETPSIKKIAAQLGVSVSKVRRTLITEGLWSSKASRRIGILYDQGLSVTEISDRLNIVETGVVAYLPYSRGSYDDKDRSDEARRSVAYRNRKTSAAERQVNRNDSSMINITLSSDGVAHEDSPELCYPLSETEAMLLHLEIATEGISPEDREVLRRYGRAQGGISRDIVVPANITLHALHYAIQRAFGWQNSHLHHYRMPDNVIRGILGKSKQETTFPEWGRFCGLYFRFPSEDMNDLYWDDDYDGTISIKSWLRQKYTGSYIYGGVREHYLESQIQLAEFCKANPVLRVPPTFQEWQQHKAALDDGALTHDEVVSIDSVLIGGLERILEKPLDELLERLTAKELLLPSGVKPEPNWETDITKLSQKQQKLFEEKKDALIDYHRRIGQAMHRLEQNREQWIHSFNAIAYDYSRFVCAANAKLSPITDRLRYEYDYGDSWNIDISCKEIFRTEIGFDCPKMEGFQACAVEDAQVFSSLKVYDGQNQRVRGELRTSVATAIMNWRPVCVSADGLCVMDDVGGIPGYCEFLRDIHELPDDEAEQRKDWARSMGWTGRRVKPEQIL